MAQKHLIIIGGGLAGLSAGCYALRSGFSTTIVEHNLALGGVCTAWPRGPYVIDGCIQWLTGGPFSRLYEELEILPSVKLRTLDTWATYRDSRNGSEVRFTRDLDIFIAQLIALSKQDEKELERLRRGVADLLELKPPLEARELTTARETLRAWWDLRGAVGSLVHYRKPIGAWAREHLESQQLRRMFTRILPETVPTFFLLMVLGYLEQGYLSRPVGGTAAFRDVLEATYRKLGGQVVLHATVDEVLVANDRAYGVRLADGTMLESDVVLSTASAPETVLRLLGGRYDSDATRERLERWKLVEPIVLISLGVARPYAEAPALLMIDGISEFDVGGRPTETLSLRVCNDDPCFAPQGHTVIQAMLPTRYDWWATRGSRYGAEKEELADRVISKLEPHFDGIRPAVRMVDVATPLTYWGMARSWRGAYEGWQPNADSGFGSVKKQLSGLEGLYMAGQWVEPGGGVPLAVMSGRQAVQLICDAEGQRFVPTSG
jgi:phytoene dehydrogenase-like protein